MPLDRLLIGQRYSFLRISRFYSLSPCSDEEAKHAGAAIVGPSVVDETAGDVNAALDVGAGVTKRTLDRPLEQA